MICPECSKHEEYSYHLAYAHPFEAAPYLNAQYPGYSF
jgi:hypothetical protein